MTSYICHWKYFSWYKILTAFSAINCCASGNQSCSWRTRRSQQRLGIAGVTIIMKMWNANSFLYSLLEVKWVSDIIHFISPGISKSCSSWVLTFFFTSVNRSSHPEGPIAKLLLQIFYFIDLILPGINISNSYVNYMNPLINHLTCKPGYLSSSQDNLWN